MSVMRDVLLWGSRSAGLRSTLTKYAFFRSAVKKFMPGEDVGSALAAAEALKLDGIGTILTHLGENISSKVEADSVTDHYMHVLDDIKRRKLDCHISVKLTQLGLDIDEGLAEKNLRALVRRAKARGNVVWIDMENSPYVDRTLALYRKVKARHKNVGVCLQAYLRRTERDVESLLPLDPWIRLVKGAYAETEAVAFQKKSEVDQSYRSLAWDLLAVARKRKMKIGIATHDQAILDEIRFDPGSESSCEFQMLYGIKTDLQRQIARSKAKMRCLISYGTFWFPWYMRRLAERPANIWFVAKNIFT
ncbi:MAG TPA: proline dehydrogenase family protein [Bacteroidota bacterium]|nr:proline dehydrogenase family protein [Bacteroidota bacterium]